MRIAMISTPFLSVPPRDYGGTELIVYELVEGLTAKGHEVVLYATGDATSSAELKYLYSRPQWPPAPLPDINHVSWAISEIISDGSFDIVHTHSAFALPFSRLHPEIPLIYTLHHARDEDLSQFYRNFPDIRYIAISENQRRQEIPLRNCMVIPHGLDEDRYRYSETPADYVCFIGRFAEVKGPHTAIDVAKNAGLPIKVAGEVHQVDKEFAEREVMPRHAQPHVDFLGCVGNDRKVPLLQNARALLAPITWEEPFGLFMIEAMLSGCPVVGFPRGDLPELVEPGITGFIVTSPAEMAEAIRPGGVLDSFDRRRCRQRAAIRFSRSRLASDHEIAYAELLSRSPARKSNLQLQHR